MKNNFSLLLLAITLFMFKPSIAVAYGGIPQIVVKENAEGRAKYAKNLQSFLSKIDEGIPSLSPTQKQWLDKEMGEYKRLKNNSRWVEISNTKEYQMQEAKDYLNQLLFILKLIINKPSVKEEMYQWSLVVEILMRPEFCNSIRAMIENFL